jgi:hypothetical protein
VPSLAARFSPGRIVIQSLLRPPLDALLSAKAAEVSIEASQGCNDLRVVGQEAAPELAGDGVGQLLRQLIRRDAIGN